MYDVHSGCGRVCGVGPVRVVVPKGTLLEGEVAGVRRVLRLVFMGSSIREREERRNCLRADGWKQNEGVRLGDCVGWDMVGGAGGADRRRGRVAGRELGGGSEESVGEVAQNHASLSVWGVDVVRYGYIWVGRVMAINRRSMSYTLPRRLRSMQ